MTPLLVDVRSGHIFGTKLARSTATIAGKHERRVPDTGRRLAAQHLATGLFLQERQESHLPRNEHTESLSMALSRQNTALHVQVDTGSVLCDEVRILST